MPMAPTRKGHYGEGGQSPADSCAEQVQIPAVLDRGNP